MVSANDAFTDTTCTVDSWGNINGAGSVTVSCRALATGQLASGNFCAAIGTN